jgi:hemerythrin-like domain-containing protein
VLAAASRFVGFLARHELVHFALEESLLLPAMPDEPRAEALAQRMLEDHEYLRLAARQLADAMQPASPEYLRELGRRLRSHVQMEERELFPYIEQTLDPARLEETRCATHWRAWRAWRVARWWPPASWPPSSRTISIRCWPR